MQPNAKGDFIPPVAYRNAGLATTATSIQKSQCHSVRNASTGLMELARTAGNKQANTADAARIEAAPKSKNGFLGET
jgi:hypothetical protein